MLRFYLNYQFFSQFTTKVFPQQYSPIDSVKHLRTALTDFISSFASAKKKGLLADKTINYRIIQVLLLLTMSTTVPVGWVQTLKLSTQDHRMLFLFNLEKSYWIVFKKQKQPFADVLQKRWP